jgi:hypothetical protein
MPKQKTVQFQGLVAVGRTKDEAIKAFRALAAGNSTVAYMDKDQEFAFVTNSSSNLTELFNPKTGNMDLAAAPSILQSLSFASTSGDVEVNYHQCTDGCKSHLVFESADLVKHCVVCSTPILTDDDDDEGDEPTSGSDDEEEDEMDDHDEPDGDEDDLDEEEEEEEEEEDDESTSGSDDDEEEEDEEEEDEEDDLDEEEPDDDEDDESTSGSDDDEDEPLIVVAATLEEARSLFTEQRFQALSSGDELPVEYLVCSSAECGAHILSEEDITECPTCHSALQEPDLNQASESGDDEEDEEDNDGTGSMDVLGDEEDEDDDLELDDDEDDMPESSGDNSISVYLHEANPDFSKVTAADLDLSFSSSIQNKPTWTAYLKGCPVALCTKDDAGKNADIFETSDFGRGAMAAAKHGPVMEVLEGLGFKPITCHVDLPSHVNKTVARQVATAKSQMEHQHEEFQERLMASLATASIGLTRGFFVDQENPLKAVLCTALKDAGMRQPEVFLDQAFASAADPYHKVLFSKALEIMKEPDHVQESLAKAVLGMRYQPTKNGEVTTDVSMSSSVSDRLSSLGTNTVVTTTSPGDASGKGQQHKQTGFKSESANGSTDFQARVAGIAKHLGRNAH